MHSSNTEVFFIYWYCVKCLYEGINFGIFLLVGMVKHSMASRRTLIHQDSHALVSTVKFTKLNQRSIRNASQPGVCIQQRNTTGLLLILHHFLVVSASKLTPTNMYIARARDETISVVGLSWLIIRTAYWVQLFLAWSSIAQSVCQPAFSLLSIRFQRRWSNPAFTKCRQLISFRFYITPLPPLHQNKHRTICISPESGWNHIGCGV